MRIGTKSILFGAHAFWLHPWFVAYAWWRLYGFPWDPRLWFAFFLHDLGYWGKPNIDGPEGERHPELGAKIMGQLFDPIEYTEAGELTGILDRSYEWEHFTLYHSRSYAKMDNMPVSRLCIADKLATAITPWWLYFPMTKATGEIHEYRALVVKGKYAAMHLSSENDREWYRTMQVYLKRWVEEHKDGREDTWTPRTEQ